MKKNNLVRGIGASIALATATLTAMPSQAVTLEELAEKMDRLEAENRELKGQLNELKVEQSKQTAQAAPKSKPAVVADDHDYIRADHQFSYDMLDPTRNINRKQQHILKQKQAGVLKENSVTLGGAVTAIADVQDSSHDSKFGYLMRHPTSANQIGTNVSEAVLHSAQIGITANLGSWITAYSEILYDPEQSFGSGTITSLTRNQLQLRRGYVMLGNLDKSPLFLSLGKMATPFGLTDTVNPFTASTVWHAFGGLAYGIQGGYYGNGLSVSLMGIQGGSQFRAANSSVADTNVPSRLNNFAADINYTLDLGASNSLLFGASYQSGSAYCHNFPVVHFNPCTDDNPAYDLYGKLNWGNFEMIAEFAKTLEEWPGTFNPTIPQFAAHDVTSWGIGGKYRASLMGAPLDISTEFSTYISGPDGSPWERQNQLVLGLSSFVGPSVKLFGEYIHVDGYVPLNFLSGGNLGPGQTHSVNDSDSDVFVVGVNAAF